MIYVNRAQNAKPCIIFFDEFESIAPKLVLLIIVVHNINCFMYLFIHYYFYKYYAM